MPARLTNKYPNKRAFITGAGSGLGLSFATLLARAGWKIGISDISEERLNTAASSISAAGGTPMSFIFDVSDYAAFKQAVNDFVVKFGGIDIGINNAGLGCGGLIHELPIETFRKIIDVNLMGVVNGCHIFVPIMKDQSAGHILNVSSAAAFIAAPRMSAYNVSKGGVLALSETLRGELVEHGVLVSVLMPTYVRTNIGKDALGPPQETRRAQILVDRSALSAEEVAKETLELMHSGELYIVLPSEAKFLWRFKRFFPDKFWRFMAKEVERHILKIDQNIKP